MISKPINCSTGPVSITEKVRSALLKPAISHRSKEFMRLFKATTQFLCEHFKVNKSYIATGSGTFANEVILWQIRSLGTKGMIVSNGEFGERLVGQAKRMNVMHDAHCLDWGDVINSHEVIEACTTAGLKWILLCHCETSTGVLNPLEELASLAKQNGILVFADCTSTVGTRIIDLSMVAAATCSSGKGLAGLPGLAIVMTNLNAAVSDEIPCYADLYRYDKMEGVPFTISSNMIEALQNSLVEKLTDYDYYLLRIYQERIRRILRKSGLLVFDSPGSVVFTLRLPYPEFADELETKGLIVSHGSSYLTSRGLFQLALFGKFSSKEFDVIAALLHEIFLNEQLLVRQS